MLQAEQLSRVLGEHDMPHRKAEACDEPLGGESGDELVLTRAEQAKISNAVEKDRRGGGVVRANSSKPASVQLCLHRPVDDSSRSAAAEEARAPRSCTKATTARGPKKRKAKAAVSKQQPSLMKFFKPMGT